MTSEFSAILTDVEGYLAYLKDEGIRTVRVAPDVVAALQPVAAPPSGPDASSMSGAEQLELIADDIESCSKCELQRTRTNVVPGQGCSSPEIMFIGEAPGYDEDQQGLAFIGRAGKLLTRMIEAMGYTREEVFIGNILKCRPPDNRAPFPHEMETCMPYLRAQIAVLKPKVIIALGATATKGLMQTTQGISKLRGTWMSFEGIDLMPTYHPAYLLRNPAAKKYVWEDLQEVLRHLGRPIPEVQKKTPSS